MRRTHALLHAVHRLSVRAPAADRAPAPARAALPEADDALIARIRELAAGIVPATVRAGVRDDLGPLGWDSLARVRLHAALEGALGVVLEPGALAVEPMTLCGLAATRAQLLRLAGCDLDRSTAILGRVHLQGKGLAASRLHIGRGCTIAPDVTFGLDADITIGDNVSVGPLVILHTGTHELGPSWRRMTSRVTARPIVIEDGVWVGMGAIILAGSRLGRGCVISAGAVVSGEVAPDQLVAGNPAAVIDQLPAMASPGEIASS